MPDIQLNGQSIVTSSATTAPASGAVETWTVTALGSGIPALITGQTYALVDATSGASAAQQREIVRMTTCDGPGDTSVSVTRGADGTTPVAHAATATFNIVAVDDWLNRAANGVPTYASQYRRGRYDQGRGLYNFKSSNTRILDQGRSDAMTNGITRHVFIGDSVGAGATSGWGVNTYDRLRAPILAMRDQMAVMGIPANGTGFVRMNDANGPVFDTRWTTPAPTGTWVSTSAVYSQATTVNATVTFTPDRAGTMLETGYVDFGGATVTISIDGAASGANFGTFSTTAGSGTAIKRFRMTGCTIRSTSVIKYTITVIGTGFKILGAAVWTPNAGIVVDNWSASGTGAYTDGTGATSGAKVWSDMTNGQLAYFQDLAGRKTVLTDVATTAAFATITSASSTFTGKNWLIGEPIDQFPDIDGTPFPPNTIITGITSATVLATSNAAQVTVTGKTINVGRDPHCVHIALGGNDVMAGVATMAQLKTALTAIRNVFPSSDCILHLENEPDPTYATAAEELAFQQAMYDLADALDVPLADWRDRFGDHATALANGAFQDYIAHMIPGAYAELGSSWAQAIGGGSGQPQYWKAPVYDGDLTNKKYIDDLVWHKTLNNTAATSGTSATALLSCPMYPNQANATDTYEIFMNGISSSTGTLIFKVHVGAAGTTADTVAWTSITSAAQVANQRAGITSGLLQVRGIGASGTVQVECLGFAQAALLPTVVAAVGTVTVDTTKPWFITISVTASAGIYTAQSAVIRRV